MKHSRKNFEKTGESNVILIGKIYANWCGHCQHLKPEWNKMKTSIRNKLKTLQNVAVRFVEIEQNQEEQKVGKINRVYLKNSDKKLSMQDGYPTLFRIHGGQVEYFQGGRSAEEMEKFYLKNGENQSVGQEMSQKQEGGGFLDWFNPSKQPLTPVVPATGAPHTDNTNELRPPEQPGLPANKGPPAEKAEPKTVNPNKTTSWLSGFNFFGKKTEEPNPNESNLNKIGGKSKKNRTKKPKKIKSTRKHKRS